MSKSSAEGSFLASLLAQGLPRPVREFPFAEVIGRKHRADFAWPDEKLLVEVQGGTWTGGRHTSGAGYLADCRKTALAACLGWTVIPVTSQQARSGEGAVIVRCFFDKNALPIRDLGLKATRGLGRRPRLASLGRRPRP